MTTIAVVHLVRARNGIEPLKRFLESYAARRAGRPHELLLVFKGFGGGGPGPAYRDLLAGVPHRALGVADRGFDIQAYLAAARAFPHEYFCFLNSFSVLLADDWLRHLHEIASRPGVGLAGATGSWESPYSAHLQNRDPNVLWLRSAMHRLRAACLRRHFDPFPNPHVRTNAFLIRRDVLRAVRARRIVTKAGAHRFESGRDGLTRQVHAMKLDALVVGSDGRGYASAEWPRSRTFRAGRQENLLVADNQTNAYLAADPASRDALARRAWGADAIRGE